MCQLLSQESLSWYLIKGVNCICLNWQFKNSKFSCLATKHQIGVANVSIAPIDNYIQMQNALQTQCSFKNMPALVKCW